MNIFWLDENEELAASYHCDKHVVKMCLEYAQLLSSVLRVNSPELCTINFPYRLTHKNHPCAVWARASNRNYNKLYKLAIALGEVYTYRYKKRHKSIETIVKQLPSPRFNSTELTELPQCMPEQYRIKNDPVTAYRIYYIEEKAGFAEWKYSDTPAWFNP
jgi:hypothetical protein